MQALPYWYKLTSKITIVFRLYGIYIKKNFLPLFYWDIQCIWWSKGNFNLPPHPMKWKKIKFWRKFTKKFVIFTIFPLSYYQVSYFLWGYSTIKWSKNILLLCCAHFFNQLENLKPFYPPWKCRPVYILIATESVIFSPKIVFILRREKICFRKTWLFWNV